jgi:hypothetical protein
MAVEAWEVGDDPTVSPDARVVATAPERSDRRALGREHRLHWLLMAVLGVFLLLGAVGVLGVRTARSSAAAGGYDLEVTYAAVSRPGLATPLEIEIRRRDGWPQGATVQVAVSSQYLAMFDENGLMPDPAGSTRTAEAVIWELDPPETGDALVVSFDGRIEPGTQWGRDGDVQVLDRGRPVVEADFHTWVMP